MKFEYQPTMELILRFILLRFEHWTGGSSSWHSRSRPPHLTPVLDLMYQHNPNPQGLFSPFSINFVGITQGKNNQDKDILNIIDQ